VAFFFFFFFCAKKKKKKRKNREGKKKIKEREMGKKRGIDGIALVLLCFFYGFGKIELLDF
jgi:hypothetical protein